MSKKAQAESTASAHWTGDLMSGHGAVTKSGSGKLKDLAVSWASRSGTGHKGETTPEELLAAAHASCFAMALSHELAGAGHAPESLDVTSKVGFDPKVGGGFEVSFSELTVRGKVPGAKTIEDVKKSYESKVPMGRGCTTADVMKAIYYLMDQQYETGQALPVTGGQVMLS